MEIWGVKLKVKSDPEWFMWLGEDHSNRQDQSWQLTYGHYEYHVRKDMEYNGCYAHKRLFCSNTVFKALCLKERILQKAISLTSSWSARVAELVYAVNTEYSDYRP